MALAQMVPVARMVHKVAAKMMWSKANIAKSNADPEFYE
jgi:hypothetical protein